MCTAVNAVSLVPSKDGDRPGFADTRTGDDRGAQKLFSWPML